MKMIMIIIIILFLLNNNAKGQTDSVESFFPLTVGNYWQYKVTSIFSQDTTIHGYNYIEVLKDTIMGNPANTHYKVKAFREYLTDKIIYLRYDSESKSIIEYIENKGEERLLFKLDAIAIECWDSDHICCEFVDTMNVFNHNKIYKLFIYWGLPNWEYYLAKDFGPVKIIEDWHYIVAMKTIYDLVYARISGVEYGTYITSIENNFQLPNSYSLFQNFPNPFNPSTTIRYSIPERSLIKINIYNILGEEIKKLVAEEKPAGSYEVNFDGTDLPNGIYFYRLESNKYSFTRKMILLK